MLTVAQYPYLGNARFREVHVANCVRTAMASRRNKLAYQSLERAFKHSFNGCHFYLPEFSKAWQSVGLFMTWLQIRLVGPDFGSFSTNSYGYYS